MAESAIARHRHQSYRKALSSIEEIKDQSDTTNSKMECPKQIDTVEFGKLEDSNKMGFALIYPEPYLYQSGRNK